MTYKNMELRLPAHYADLTLGHLMALESETDPVKRVSAVTGVPTTKLREMPHKLVTEADGHLAHILTKEHAQHKEIIELRGIKYGFIPNWEELRRASGSTWKSAPPTFGSTLTKP